MVTVRKYVIFLILQYIPLMEKLDVVGRFFIVW